MDGIGLVSGVLGIVGFIQDNVPDDPPEGANIRVKLGLGDDDNHGIVSPYPPLALVTISISTQNF